MAISDVYFRRNIAADAHGRYFHFARIGLRVCLWQWSWCEASDGTRSGKYINSLACRAGIHGAQTTFAVCWTSAPNSKFARLPTRCTHKAWTSWATSGSLSMVQLFCVCVLVIMVLCRLLERYDTRRARSFAAQRDVFPSGMRALSDYLHSKGLKIGLYTGLPLFRAGHRTRSATTQSRDIASACR